MPENFPYPLPNKEHLNIQSAIEDYLIERKRYFENTYPSDVETLLAGERKMIVENLKKGHLSEWQPGQDILVAIVEHIQKSAATESGSFSVGETLSEKIPKDLARRIEMARKHRRIVSMNDARTFSSKDVKEDEFEIFSLGQAGCTNVIVAGLDEKNNIITSVFHFDPTQGTALIDAVVKARN